MPPIYHNPSPPLDTYIERLYYLDGPMPYSHERIIPDPRLDLKFSFGGTIRAYKEDNPEPLAICSDSWWVGLWNTYHVVEWPSNVQFFGILFKPGAAYPFLGIPVSELHSNVVALDEFWGNLATEVREQLSAAPSLEARFALIERFLVARLHTASSGFSAVQYALTQIACQNGALSIRALSEQMGMSQNHLSTLFKRLVGGAPKEIARLYRFQYMLNNIDATQPLDWTQVAFQYGYYDQSHFNKEFAAFTGHNPTEYRRLRCKVYTENPYHARYLRQLPANPTN
jgi:AraC-like DNA-binding protein